VRRHTADWAHIIELRAEGERLAQFKDNVTEALHACLRAHIFAAYRWRWSDARKAFLRAAQHAATMIQAQRKLEAELLRGPLNYLVPMLIHDHPDGQHLLQMPLTPISELETKRDMARRWAERCKQLEKRGREKFYAFGGLVKGLRRAFESATRGAATLTHREDRRDEDEWGGRFWELVEAVLPVAQHVAVTVAGAAFDAPATPGARGKYLQRLLSDD
jgi:hypothetical protein